MNLGWCPYCLKYECPPECPNYIPPKATVYCGICGEGVYGGDEYIESDCGEIAHYDCLQNIDDLLKWLGCKVKIMEDI